MNKVTIRNKGVFHVEGNKVNGQEMLLDVLQTGERFYHLLHKNKSYNIEVVKFDKETKTYTLKVNGNVYEAQVKDKFDQLMEQMGFDAVGQNKLKELKAPMPGLVIDVKVTVGSEVKKGDAVLVLEAMKMENVLKASGDGKVKSIEVQKGKSVEKNQVLIVFE
ncbi:MAG: acetyl-CoA carboxylase biotin carboxyl carrier protein subunit [Chitinophagales bacterium]